MGDPISKGRRWPATSVSPLLDGRRPGLACGGGLFKVGYHPTKSAVNGKLRGEHPNKARECHESWIAGGWLPMLSNRAERATNRRREPSPRSTRSVHRYRSGDFFHRRATGAVLVRRPRHNHGHGPEAGPSSFWECAASGGPYTVASHVRQRPRRVPAATMTHARSVTDEHLAVRRAHVVPWGQRVGGRVIHVPAVCTRSFSTTPKLLLGDDAHEVATVSQLST